MGCSKVRLGSYPANASGSTALRPIPLPKAPLGEKHLDAALLAVVHRRKRELSILPGVPFH